VSWGRFVATAVACEAFLLKTPLADEDKLLDLRAAVTLFADIRRAILKEVYRTMGITEEEKMEVLE
jgi:hypothetical protein